MNFYAQAIVFNMFMCPLNLNIYLGKVTKLSLSMITNLTLRSYICQLSFLCIYCIIIILFVLQRTASTYDEIIFFYAQTIVFNRFYVPLNINIYLHDYKPHIKNLT